MRRFPKAQIKITDSYEEVRETAERYSFILIDNPLSLHGSHCEHFDLFPDVFRIATDAAIVVVNVIPEITAADREFYPYVFNPEQLGRRRSFYRTRRPESISLTDIAAAYERLASLNGFGLEWHFFEKRNFVFYMVLKLVKRETNGRQSSQPGPR